MVSTQYGSVGTALHTFSLSYLHVGVSQRECEATVALSIHADVFLAGCWSGYGLEATYELGQPQEVDNPESVANDVIHSTLHGTLPQRLK